MNYNNITKENFDKYLEAFNESLFNLNWFLFENEHDHNPEVIITSDYEDTEPEIIELYELKKKGLNYKNELNIVFNSINYRLDKIYRFSHNDNIYFDLCSSIVYENTFESRYSDFENEFIDVNVIEFIENEYNSIIYKYFIEENRTFWDSKVIDFLDKSKTKKFSFLKSILLEKNYIPDVDYNGHYASKEFLKVRVIEQNKTTQQKQPDPEQLDFLNSTKIELGIMKEIHTNNTYRQIATPQNNINVFLHNDLNIEIFEYIEGIQYEGKPKTLDYFNLLFSEFNFFVENANNYLKIKEHFVIPKLKTISKEDEILYLKSLIYFKLVELIKQSFPIENRKNIIKKTCEHIEKANQSIMDFIFQPLHFTDEFQLLREEFEKLDYKSQLIQWTGIKYTILQDVEENSFGKREASIFLKKIDFELERIENLLKIETNQPQKLKPFQKPTKNILDFINNVKNKEIFLDELKITFPTERGKSIKIIIELLQKENILIFGNREFKILYNELKTFFVRDIGTRQSINDVKFEDIHTSIIEPIQKKLNPLIIRYKT
jgi:hypothetical protein